MKIVGTLKQVTSNKDGSKFYYVYPIYDVVRNHELRAIDKHNEYPNKGTIFIVNPPQNIDKWLKKVVIIDGEIAENSNYILKKEDPNAAKYAIFDKEVIRLPSSTEIIELIDLDNNITIEDIIDNEKYRYIETKVLPLSSRILLSIGDYIYGCFEYAEDQKNLEWDMQKIRLITKETTNGLPKYSIKKYKKKDIQSHINPIDIFISMDEFGGINSEKKQFIYNTNILDSIKPVETLDFIEDKNLINMLHKILNDSKKYELTNKNIREIKEVITTTHDMDFIKERESRLVKLIEKTKQLAEFKGTLLRDFFQTEEGKRYKKDYLENNHDLLRDIVEEVEGYKEIEGKIQELHNKKSTLENEIKTLSKKIDKLKEEAEKKMMKEVQQKLYEKESAIEKLDKCIAEKNTKLEDISKKLNIVGDFEKAKEESEILKKDIDTYRRQKTELSDEINTLTNKYEEFERQVIKEALKKRNSDFAESIVNIVTANSTNKIKNSKEKEFSFQYKDLQERVLEDMTLEKIISRFEINFEMANRKIEYADIINYLICVTQRFMTVFAGEPGVGKTSLCVLIAKCLGLYDERFLQISVERGWTSFKDLVGYYNPITKQIEKSPTGIFDALAGIDYENKNNIDIPYLFLLDEANLSSIEHYWSKFLMFCDRADFNKNTLDISEECEFKLTEGAKFFATINFDHTTEMLSNRFLDRSWVIMVDPPDLTNIIDYEEEEVPNVDTIISYKSLKKYFIPQKDSILNSSIVNAFKNFNQILLDNNIYISARSIYAIKNYCMVAQNYMEGSFEPLDYAVSQKILPMLNGYGDYRIMIVNLMDVCDKYALTKCWEILKRILDRGDLEHGYYQFFDR